MAVQFVCDRCGNIGEKKYKSHIRSKNYCSAACGNASKSRPGNLNSRYGIKWTDDEKLKQSELIKSKVDDKYRFNAGKANRGKKFTNERIHAMHGHRSSDSYKRSHSDETKLLIGKKSAEKFKKSGFKERFRKSMEESKIWIPLEDLDAFTLYKRECYWVRPMWNLIDDVNQQQLLSELNVFHPTKNSKGCVRDHLFTKLDGFIHSVPPEILRHPANCRIITHSKNASKGSKSDISLDMLFNLIYNYKRDWVEHDTVINLIQRYKDGFRWSKSIHIT